LTNWPEGTRPDQSSVFCHNEIRVPTPPQRVWDWLVCAGMWSRWYRNAGDVVLPGDQLRLTPNMVFRWTTLGARITSKVVEYDAPHRIGWIWWRRGARGYHGWLLEPDKDGTRVITEETQQGLLPWLLRPVLQRALSIAHDYWLRQLARKATQGLPED
jgi:Polyketide cyclase / dehydrase and lipid transport